LTCALLLYLAHLSIIRVFYKERREGVTQNFGKGSKIAKKTGGREEEEAA
jgi:hypothetical protein